jgi:type I protein arginine methyltransferase
MLDSVLFARDKYLVSSGLMMPDKAMIYICGLEDAQIRQERIDFWDDVYGFDMSVIKDIALKEPIVDVVDCKNVMTDISPILKLDILTCTKDDLAFTTAFRLTANRNDFMHGIVAYFECAFTQVHKPIGWSTSPFSQYTHWKQTLFYLTDPLTVCEGETIEGSISCSPNDLNPRDLNIRIMVDFNGCHMKKNMSSEYRLR